MTNGEKIQQMFPNAEIGYGLRGVVAVTFIHKTIFDLDWWNAEYKEPTTKNDLALIHTEGLDEGIRCAMCTNSIKSDRGCDGSCAVNNAMYKEVMDVIENHIADTDKMIEPTTKNDLGVELIDRAELLKAMDTWDKFGYTARYGLERLDKDDKGFVPYVKYDDMVNCVKGMPSVTPQPRWIPVSERYPKIEDEHKYFLVTDDKGKVRIEGFYLSLDKEPRPYFSGMVDVIAWMPLPKAYREVKE